MTLPRPMLLDKLAVIAMALALTAGSAYAQGGDKDGADAKKADGEPADTEATPDGTEPAAEKTEGAADQEGADIDALRQEYLRLRDQLFRSRARAAAVASAMYSTKLTILLSYDTGRFYAVDRATIRLDGANVFDDSSGAIANDKAPRFEGYVAPGRHVLSVRIEATGKDDERFTSTTENTVTFQAPAGKDVTITARAKDGGNIPYAWKKKEKGSYQLTLNVKVDTKKRPTAKPASPGKKTAKRGNDAARSKS